MKPDQNGQVPVGLGEAETGSRQKSAGFSACSLDMQLRCLNPQSDKVKWQAGHCLREKYLQCHCVPWLPNLGTKAGSQSALLWIFQLPRAAVTAQFSVLTCTV